MMMMMMNNCHGTFVKSTTYCTFKRHLNIVKHAQLYSP